MHKYGEGKMTRIMMATVPHVISGSGLRKFQADEFLLTWVYNVLSHLVFCPYSASFMMLRINSDHFSTKY